MPPPLFLFVKTIEKVIRLCTVLNFFLSGGCEDRDYIILLVFLQIKIGGGHFDPPPPIITKVYLPLIITKVKILIKEEMKHNKERTCILRHCMNENISVYFETKSSANIILLACKMFVCCV